jgi:nucleoid-associated protein YgaU
MQQIERYGVIALVLLLVTIAAVSFWDDGETAAPNTNPKADAEAVAGLRPRTQHQSPGARTPGAGASLVHGASRRGGRNLPSTGRGTAGGRELGRSAAASKQGGGKSGAERGTLPRRSSASAKAGVGRSRPTFETLPATVVEGDPGLSSRGYDRDEIGALYGAGARDDQGVEFPDLPARKRGSGGTPARGAPTAHFQSPTSAARGGQQPMPTAARAGSSYVVVPGDTLSEIASKVLGSAKRWPEIQSLNGGLDPGAIQVGMKLKMPAGSSAGRVASLKPVTIRESKAIPPSSAEGTYYRVRAGDVLSQIAQDLLGGASRWREIVALNPGLNPDVLVEGQRLKMPAGARKSASATRTAIASLSVGSSSRGAKESRVR